MGLPAPLPPGAPRAEQEGRVLPSNPELALLGDLVARPLFFVRLQDRGNHQMGFSSRKAPGVQFRMSARLLGGQAGMEGGCGLQAPTAICSKALGLAVSGPCQAQDPRIPAGKRRLRAGGLALTCPAHACPTRSHPSSETGWCSLANSSALFTEIKSRWKVGAVGRRKGHSVAEWLLAPGTVLGAL